MTVKMTQNRLRQRLEPAIRRVFHLYSRFARAMTLGVRGLVVDGQNRIFLVEHSYVAGWHMPGGGVEIGETLVDALTRELAEEGNIRLTGTPALHGMFFNGAISRRDHIAVYVVRAFHQDAPPRPDREIIGHGFFALDALPPETTPGTRRRIAEVFSGAPLSTRW
jgi:ADP-ribose pyrophosphatase YjhB (NUDIX family)